MKVRGESKPSVLFSYGFARATVPDCPSNGVSRPFETCPQACLDFCPKFGAYLAPSLARTETSLGQLSGLTVSKTSNPTPTTQPQRSQPADLTETAISQAAVGPPVDSPSTHLRSPCTHSRSAWVVGKSGVGAGELPSELDADFCSFSLPRHTRPPQGIMRMTLPRKHLLYVHQ